MDIRLKNVTKAEADYAKRLTDCQDPAEAIAKIVTLLGRGRVYVRPTKAQYKRALSETLREEADGKFTSGTAFLRELRRLKAR